MVSRDESTVGERIKSLRMDRGLSTKELALKVGCSDEYLEWVEEGQVEPPVALLLRLAKAMQLDSGSFLENVGTRAKRMEEVAKRTKHYSYQTLTPPEADKHLMAFSIAIPPKTDHDGVGYRHEGEEFIYVLEGKVDVTVDRLRHTLCQKESLRFNSNLDHFISNPGETEARLLVILYIP
ncbi:MAG: helix-turn-helix transcriptional regulator [Deltaproteobacteria bacterium]|nr:helix-turn-helix transcriptional regulator [Deltaproteobacteria bacterium]MBW2065439.1 helix-turn-helix transcriptional regulator [Deltaproteobacteria bacterium]